MKPEEQLVVVEIIAGCLVPIVTGLFVLVWRGGRASAEVEQLKKSVGALHGRLDTFEGEFQGFMSFIRETLARAGFLEPEQRHRVPPRSKPPIASND